MQRGGSIRCSPLGRSGLGAVPGAPWRSRGYTCPSYRQLGLFRSHFRGFLSPFSGQFSCLGITFRVGLSSKLLRFPDMFIRVLCHDYRCFELYSARNCLRADRKREGGGRGDTDIWKHGETGLKMYADLLILAVDAPRGRRQWPQASRIRRPPGSGVRGSWGVAYPRSFRCGRY